MSDEGAGGDDVTDDGGDSVDEVVDGKPPDGGPETDNARAPDYARAPDSAPAPDGGASPGGSEDIPTVEREDIDKDPIEEFLDDFFEPLFFMSRYVIIVPVVISLLGAILMFGIGAYFTYEGLHELQVFHAESVALPLIKAIDAFLLGLILIIFSFGVYDFFVSELEPAEEAGVRPDWLKFESVGELKTKVFEVVIVVLAIMFYEQMKANKDSFTSFSEFLIIPIGTAFLAVAVGMFKYFTE